MHIQKMELPLDGSYKESLEDIFSLFKKQNKEIYLVGGCVRDLLLDKTPKDYDLCTNATPEETKKILEAAGGNFYHFIDTGLKHGTITVHDIISSKFYEITTYRIDSKYSDSRHPDSVEFTQSLEEDLKRRDLTINSLAYDPTTNELLMLDPTFLYDLKLGIIRTVGDPAERYGEDALRMLRVVRFASQLNFSIEKATYDALSTCAPLLEKISKERIREELDKILLSDNPQYLEVLVTTGIEKYLFDGITPITDIVNCEHENPYHYTSVFHHTMDVVRGVSKDSILRWSALFHDMGKPAVKTLKPGTTNHYRYIGHPEKSVEIADQIMEILKFSNSEKKVIHNFVLYHDYPLSDVSDKKFKQKVVEIGEENFLNFLQLRQADALAHRLSVSTRFAIDAISAVKDRFVKYLTNPGPVRLKDLALNGDDLVRDGFLKGPEIGECLNWMLNIVLEHPEYNTREKLLEYLQKFKEMVFQSS